MALRRPPIRLLHRFAIALGVAALSVAAAASVAAARGLRTSVPGEVVVGYRPATPPAAQAAAARAAGADARTSSGGPSIHVLHVAPDHVAAAIAALRRRHDVAYAVPNAIAHAAAVAPPPAGLPNDPGVPGFPGGLAALQWNFYGPAGVNALQAWADVAAAGRPGGKGVRIALLDTGVAYQRYKGFRASPDFAGTKFVAGHDFVADTSHAVDRNRDGHGTHVAGTLAETTSNGIGVSGLAWGATIVPVRVLDQQGDGDAVTIAAGIRYAVRHGAKVINMSLEFLGVRRAEIPEITSAIRDANRKGVVMVASSGNEGQATIAYPARDGTVISVGATTDDGCLADFSNDGAGLDVVAPGGGDDSNLPSDPNCKAGHHGLDVYQETYTKAYRSFGLPSHFVGTSMAAPHVSATAALVIASGVLGVRPTPAQIVCRIKATAKPLGIAGPNRTYGYGLVDAGAATSPAVLTPQCLTAR